MLSVSATNSNSSFTQAKAFRQINSLSIISAYSQNKIHTASSQANSIPWKTVFKSLFDLQRVGIAISVTYLINQFFDFLTANNNTEKLIKSSEVENKHIHKHNSKAINWSEFGLKELQKTIVYFSRLSVSMLASMMIFNIMPRIKRNGFKFKLEKAEMYSEKGLRESLLEPFQSNKLSLIFKLAGLNTGLQALQDIGIQSAPDNWANGISLVGALSKIGATFLACRFILNPNTDFGSNATFTEKLVILLNSVCPCHGLIVCMAEIEALVNAIWQIIFQNNYSKSNHN